MAAKYHDIFYTGYFYHIYNRGINNEFIFKSKRNYHFFLERWDKYLGELLDVYVYCLLPNHFHFFVRVKAIESIANESITKLSKFRNANADSNDNSINDLLEHQFMLFFRSYALAFNKENKRTGSLFQKGFKRIRVDNERYFTAIIHYIHNNVIHHHLEDGYEKWPFSSYNAVVSDVPTKVHRKEVLEWFGSKELFIQNHFENIKYDKIEKLIIE